MKYSIITIHHISNFGSVLQGYALYSFLYKNGFNAEIIDYRPSYFNHGRNRFRSFIGKVLNFRSYCSRNRKFDRFVKTHDRLSSKKFKSFNALKKYYGSKDNFFISGGDQLWNNYHPCGNDLAYKLAFTSSNRKIAYGTSMGRDNFSNDELNVIACEISGFKKIMLREQTSVSLLKQYIKVPVYHVIDPVGLLDKDEFSNIAIMPDIREPYAVMYLADSCILLDKAVEILSKNLNLKIVHICGFKKKCYCDYFIKDAGPEEILGYILHANFVLSASFHATMFSLIFEKQFVTLLPGEHTNARITDLLNYVGLGNRVIHSEKDLNQLESKIDYSHTNQVIKSFAKESREALLNALTEILKD